MSGEVSLNQKECNLGEDKIRMTKDENTSHLQRLSLSSQVYIF